MGVDVEPGPAGCLTFLSHGARIAVKADDPALLTRAAAFLPPGAQPIHAGPTDRVCSITTERSGWRLTAEELPTFFTHDLEVLFDQLASALQFSVAVSAPDLLFLHAGVVGWGGRAVVLPAPSGSGKTRLVMALIGAGATYYSDEYAVVDVTGRVHPYPRALSVRQPGGRRARRCPPEELGATVGREALPVGLVVLTRYEAGAEWRPATVSPGKSVLGLLANTVLAQRRAGAALAAWSQVATSAVTVSSRRGEAEGVVASLLELVPRW